ncbi:hypothetical protein EB796_001053 [Bugula neritina]|uniref:Uncharacterized protein n=1 Tax=Bugula neritina TaxID=10212 RepID=A0A7J7KR19_BUGNE|nr:hypothetical protein EB796_001053 [Bugula neritina]
MLPCFYDPLYNLHFLRMSSFQPIKRPVTRLNTQQLKMNKDDATELSLLDGASARDDTIRPADGEVNAEKDGEIVAEQDVEIKADGDAKVMTTAEKLIMLTKFMLPLVITQMVPDAAEQVCLFSRF